MTISRVVVLAALSQFPLEDGGVADATAFRDQSTSSIRVVGGAGPAERDVYVSEAFEITNRTYETHLLNTPSGLEDVVVRRTEVWNFDASSNERFAKILVEVFADYTHGKPPTYRLERTANELTFHTNYVDVTTFASINRTEREYIDTATQRTFLKCTSPLAELAVANSKFTGYVGYVAEDGRPGGKAAFHGRLVFVTRDKVLSEVRLRSGPKFKIALGESPRVRLAASAPGDLVRGPFIDNQYDLFPKVKANPGDRLPTFTVHLEFDTAEGLGQLDVPVVAGKFAVADEALLAAP